MHRKVLDAPNENWPVFPSFHRPTLSKRLADELTTRGCTDTEIEELRADPSQIELCVEFDAAPPSMTTDAGRHVLKRLCDQAGIELGDDHDYLMPHGARHGAGEVLVRTSGHGLPPEHSTIPKRSYASTTRISKPATSLSR
jgi:hypothetical protein